jgi:integrase
MDERPPYTSKYSDRHGKVRWRFRFRGRAVELPGQPGDDEFDRAYEAAINNRPKSEIRSIAVAAVTPKSLRSCFKGVQSSADWCQMMTSSRSNQRRVAENFLARRVEENDSIKWGDVQISELRRRHILDILADMRDTPHAAGQVLRMLRKIITYAMDQEWIDVDPTFRVKYRPKLVGHRPWTAAELNAFETRWPTGTTPRLVFEIARWTGTRRSDIATLKWSSIRDGEFVLRHQKTGMVVAFPVPAALKAELDAVRKDGEFIVLTEYGKPFSAKSLTGRFRDWTKGANLAGCTLHGLRHTLGAHLAETGATSSQIQAVLGHTTLQQADIYTKGADRRLRAKQGMEKLTGGSDTV